MDVYSIILILNKTNLKENVQHKQWKYVKTNYSRLFFEKKKITENSDKEGIAKQLSSTQSQAQ